MSRNKLFFNFLIKKKGILMNTHYLFWGFGLFQPLSCLKWNIHWCFYVRNMWIYLSEVFLEDQCLPDTRFLESHGIWAMLQFSYHSVYKAIAILLPGAFFSLVQSKQETFLAFVKSSPTKSDREKKICKWMP